ncbi:hypothetical protein AB6A40_007281 [Gnathostoma spinigerum]|uniref:Uncharacterized protein n=1 Tax=Gnathostoma spinigerum TaxID=75299 RepID=A0ABD6EVH2_9BILA
MNNYFCVCFLLFALAAADDDLDDYEDGTLSCVGIVPEEILAKTNVSEVFDKWCIGKTLGEDNECKLCMAPARDGRDEELLLCPDSPCIPVDVVDVNCTDYLSPTLLSNHDNNVKKAFDDWCTGRPIEGNKCKECFLMVNEGTNVEKKHHMCPDSPCTGGGTE